MAIVIRPILVKIQNALVIRLVTLGNRPNNSQNGLVRLGTWYGGWWVPSDITVDSNRSRVSFSVGIGHDVSFDKELLSCGFQVVALDPLEECVNYAKKQLFGFSGIYLENLGLATFSGTERFYAPKTRSHDSWSSTNSQLTDHQTSVFFEVTSLSDLIYKYKSLIGGAWTILKMDIEGAERNIIPDLCELDYSFDYVAIEMDFLSLIPFLHFRTRLVRIVEARKLIGKMNSRGYKLIKIENFNFFWSFSRGT